MQKIRVGKYRILDKTRRRGYNFYIDFRNMRKSNMATITLKAIKLENVKAVLNAIAGERQMTKLEVSKET